VCDVVAAVAEVVAEVFTGVVAPATQIRVEQQRDRCRVCRLA
jgi:hypothetical protein